MGMLATVMNGLAMQTVLERRNVPTRVQSAIPMSSVCEPYIRRRAERHMEKGRVVIFAAGTGNPFFTTDTAAALRAAEMHCDALLKGTQVDGVYSADPRKVANATRYDQLTYLDVLANDLGVMDAAAISLARENHLPIIVFNIHAPGAFAQVMRGEGAFTRIAFDFNDFQVAFKARELCEARSDFDFVFLHESSHPLGELFYDFVFHWINKRSRVLKSSAADVAAAAAEAA